VVTRVHKGDLDRITAYLPVELGTKLRMTCAAQRIELSEAIADHCAIGSQSRADLELEASRHERALQVPSLLVPRFPPWQERRFARVLAVCFTDRT
jgi:hypothetical protein